MLYLTENKRILYDLGLDPEKEACSSYSSFWGEILKSVVEQKMDLVLLPPGLQIRYGIFFPS